MNCELLAPINRWLRIAAVTCASIATLSSCVTIPRVEDVNFIAGRGINIYRWHSVPRLTDSAHYAWPPFKEVRNRFDVSDMKKIASMGFDFIRLPIDPGPFLQYPEHRRELIDEVITSVRMATSSGLRAIVDVHPRANGAPVVTGQVEHVNAIFYREYLELLLNLGEALSRMPQGSVALELLNEPNAACDFQNHRNDYETTQRFTFLRIRQQYHRLPLILTSGCYSNYQAFLQLDAKQYASDANVLFTFHYYEPQPFTHQGSLDSKWFFRFVHSLPFPADRTKYADVLSMAISEIRNSSLSADEKFKVEVETRRRLEVYFSVDLISELNATFESIGRWAVDRGIAKNRIILGEFGVLRSEPRSKAALPADRFRWLCLVRAAAEREGFGWAHWLLVGQMGLLVSDVDREPDPVVAEALGLSDELSMVRRMHRPAQPGRDAGVSLDEQIGVYSSCI